MGQLRKAACPAQEISHPWGGGEITTGGMEKAQRWNLELAATRREAIAFRQNNRGTFASQLASLLLHTCSESMRAHQASAIFEQVGFAYQITLSSKQQQEGSFLRNKRNRYLHKNADNSLNCSFIYLNTRKLGVDVLNAWMPFFSTRNRITASGGDLTGLEALFRAKAPSMHLKMLSAFCSSCSYATRAVKINVFT